MRPTKAILTFPEMEYARFLDLLIAKLDERESEEYKSFSDVCVAQRSLLDFDVNESTIGTQ